MNLFIKNITPVSVVCMAGILFLLVQFFKSGIDYNIIAFVVVYIILLALVFAVDRFMVSRIAYKKLLIFELIFLAVCTIGYMYFNRVAEIKIETAKPYFFVIYDHGDLKKSEIPKKGLFNRSTVLKIDSVIHIDKALEYEVQIKPPSGWNNKYTMERTEAEVNSEKVTIAIFAREMEYKKLSQLLQEEKKKLEISL